MIDLHAVITPSLLEQLARARLPWPKDEIIPGNAMINENFSGEITLSRHAHIAWPALIAISEKYGPHIVPDMSSFLPPVDAPTFPEQALGLHVLLDQCPRLLFAGVDGRWTSYFDRIVRRLYDDFFCGPQLPPDQRPWARSRWPGASFEYWFCAAWELATSLAHQESVPHQEDSAAGAELLRCLVEGHAGVRDPVRDGDDGGRRMSDVYAFPRLVTGVDLDRRWAFHEAAFLMLEVVEVHKPVIDRYGRYPYRNAIEGRESTEEELDWVEKTDHFAEAPPDVAARVREDVEAGRWTPLGVDRDAPASVRCMLGLS